MVYSSKKIREANNLENKYNEFDKDKYSSPSSARSQSDDNFKTDELWNKITASQKRLGIIFSLCVLLAGLGLYKFTPKFIIKRRKSIMDEDTISNWLLLKYSFIIGVGLFIAIFISSYKFPIVKNILFSEEDCDVCKA